jgi:hypothetical protein
MSASYCIVAFECAAFERVLSHPFSALLNCLVHIVAKEVTVILCINCYIVWKNIDMDHGFESQNMLAMIFLGPSGVLLY